MRFFPSRVGFLVPVHTKPDLNVKAGAKSCSSRTNKPFSGHRQRSYIGVFLVRQLFAILLVVAPITASAFSGDSGGGDGGCCAALPDNALSRIAGAYGVPRDAADRVLNELLAGKPWDELRMLSKMPGEACGSEWGGNLCDLMPDEFYRFLIDEEIARRSDVARQKSETWEFWQTRVLFGLAILGAGLGVFNTWRSLTNRKEKDACG